MAGRPALTPEQKVIRYRPNGKKTIEYRTWLCTNPTHPDYRKYGGIDVTMCEEWHRKFETFLAAVGKQPSRGYVLKMIDKEKGYHPGNVFWKLVSKNGKNQEYDIWSAMIQRCHNPNSTGYLRYGGRGIFVCQRWRDSFNDFLADVGPRPGKGYSLDRIDNSKGYEPGNVRWATQKEQGRNTRTNRLLAFRGEVKSAAEWAEITGLTYSAIQRRLDVLHWTIEKTLSTPIHRKNVIPPELHVHRLPLFLGLTFGSFSKISKPLFVSPQRFQPARRKQ